MKRDLEFFLSHTVVKGNCCEWTRCFNSDGYPRCSWNGSSNGKVHRIVWELYNGRSAEDNTVRHKCDNPKCINPEHLELGNNLDNVIDRIQRLRTHSKLTVDQVQEIRQLWTTGQYYGWELASQYKIDVNTLYSLVKRDHWKHI